MKPSQGRKLGVQPRPAADISPRRLRVRRRSSYQSPLIHLRKTNVSNRLCPSLDESVIILSEVVGAIDEVPSNSTSARDETNQLEHHDGTIIVLSDNESETDKKKKSIHEIVLDDVSEEHSELPKATKLKKFIPKNKVRSASLQICSPRPLGNRQRGKMRKRLSGTKPSTSKASSTKLPTISADLGVCDTRAPNNDLTRSNTQAEIKTVDNSSAIEKNDSISSKSKCDNEGICNVAQTNLRSSELSSQVVEAQDEVTVVWTQAETLSTNLPEQTLLCCTRKFKKPKNRPAYFIDTKGDSTTLHCLDAKSKNEGRIGRKRKKRYNPNWAMSMKRGSHLNLPAGSSSESPKQRRVNGMTSYYTKKTTPKTPGSLRDIVIDGCNIAIACNNNKRFSEDGLKLVIDFFQLRGHVVKVFIPHHERSVTRPLLEKLYKDGVVIFTPSRFIGGRRISSYDDRYILDYATMCNGIVVSLDQYRDLYLEKPEWKDTIENRLLVPTFVGDCVMFPEDPLGRDGPRLEEFLRH